MVTTGNSRFSQLHFVVSSRSRFAIILSLTESKVPNFVTDEKRRNVSGYFIEPKRQRKTAIKTPDNFLVIAGTG
jgi:hypothetical protein